MALLALILYIHIRVIRPFVFARIACTYTIKRAYPCVYIVHPESFRSNAQNAIAFARRNQSIAAVSLCAFICICVHLHAFASTVRDRVHAHTCVQSHVRELHLKRIK